MTPFHFPFDNTGKKPEETRKQISTREGQGSSREYQLGVIEVTSRYLDYDKLKKKFLRTSLYSVRLKMLE